MAPEHSIIFHHKGLCTDHPSIYEIPDPGPEYGICILVGNLPTPTHRPILHEYYSPVPFPLFRFLLFSGHRLMLNQYFHSRTEKLRGSGQRSLTGSTRLKFTTDSILTPFWPLENGKIQLLSVIFSLREACRQPEKL